MAAIHSFWPTLHRSFSVAALLPAVAVRRAVPLSLPGLLEDFLGSILRAVPKSKTTHGKKAMRHAGKGPKDKKNIVSCQACGSPKLAHHLCPNCFSQLTQAWKRVAEGTKKVLGK